jgi:hypothetical protein
MLGNASRQDLRPIAWRCRDDEDPAGYLFNLVAGVLLKHWMEEKP